MESEFICYRLESDGTNYTNESINASLITELITNLDLQDYVVLEPSRPIENSIYLQSAFMHDEGRLVVETRLLYEDGSFKHYSYITDDHHEIIPIFLDYWGQEKLPNLDGWQDITHEF